MSRIVCGRAAAGRTWATGVVVLLAAGLMLSVASSSNEM